MSSSLLSIVYLSSFISVPIPLLLISLSLFLIHVCPFSHHLSSTSCCSCSVTSSLLPFLYCSLSFLLSSYQIFFILFFLLLVLTFPPLIVFLPSFSVSILSSFNSYFVSMFQPFYMSFLPLSCLLIYRHVVFSFFSIHFRLFFCLLYSFTLLSSLSFSLYLSLFHSFISCLYLSPHYISFTFVSLFL